MLGKFHLKRMLPSRDIKVPKIIHIPRKMLEFSVFGTSISREGNIFCTKLFRVSHLQIDLPVGKVSGQNAVIRFAST